MTLKDLRAVCLAKPGAHEDFPFGPDTLVFKVRGKLFALCPARRGVDDEPLSINLKCEPELAELLREKYDVVTPGYHMNKRHWNTVILDGSVPKREVLELIDLSYSLVVKGLRKSERERLLKTEG